MPDALTLLLVAAGTGCIAHLFLDAYRTFSQEAARLRGIELQADTSRRLEYSRAIQATGGGCW